MNRLNVTILIFMLLVSQNLYGGELKIVKWGDIASINTTNILQKAKQYIAEKIPRINGADVRIIKMNISYSPRFDSNNLHVLFMHKDSFIDEPHSQEVLANEQPKTITMNLIEYIFIDFDQKGIAVKHRVEKMPYPGNKDNFDHDFKAL